jgi:hypothetical protein
MKPTGTLMTRVYDNVKPSGILRREFMIMCYELGDTVQHTYDEVRWYALGSLSYIRVYPTRTNTH